MENTPSFLQTMTDELRICQEAVLGFCGKSDYDNGLYSKWLRVSISADRLQQLCVDYLQLVVLNAIKNPVASLPIIEESGKRYLIAEYKVPYQQKSVPGAFKPDIVESYTLDKDMYISNQVATSAVGHDIRKVFAKVDQQYHHTEYRIYLELA